MGYTPGGAQLPTGAVDVGAVSTITVSPVAPVVMDVKRGTTKSKVCSLGARPRRASTAPKSGTERATRCRDIATPTTAEPGNSLWENARARSLSQIPQARARRLSNLGSSVRLLVLNRHTQNELIAPEGIEARRRDAYPRFGR